ERETRKILGKLDGAGIVDAEISMSAQCNRVAVLDGHTECVSVKLTRKASLADVRAAWEEFSAVPQKLRLPSAPLAPIHYLDAADAPQPRLHRDLDSGMAASIGRLRPCSLMDFKFVVLSHNTIRGAAGGAILAAELAVAEGFLKGHP
ncbi:MAG TPA: Asd/ArgC dimerization domain-containing protein, partial [Candidatus Polarisedimenticolia bacterium]|nr:Asd/ArgC dimerization domain-containing protein [Candidatus Polarisedimenticolia bacterium]